MDLGQLIAQGATIIDVRTPGEFAWGNAPGTINIPLNEVPHRVEEMQEMQGPLVLVCQSGNRSGQACAFLGARGIECYNGGSWFAVNYALAQKAS